MRRPRKPVPPNTVTRCKDMTGAYFAAWVKRSCSTALTGCSPPVHRGARHRQDTWRPAGARILRVRPTSRPVRGRSERFRTHGRSTPPSWTPSWLAGAVRAITNTRTSRSPKLTRPLPACWLISEQRLACQHLLFVSAVCDLDCVVALGCMVETTASMAE